MNCADQPMVLLPSHQKAQLEPVSGRDFGTPIALPSTLDQIRADLTRYS